MKLPVPFKPADRMYSGAEGARPKGGALADANRAADEGNPYEAMHIVATSGCGALLTADGQRVDDRAQIRALLNEAPYVDIEYLALMAMDAIGAGSPVEMLVRCPTCHTEWKEDSPELGKLPVLFSEIDNIPVVPEPAVSLEYPIEITGRSRIDEEVKILMTAKDLTFQYPTLASVSAALKRVGLADQARFQYFSWGMSIKSVDGEIADQKWRLEWWEKLFERMDIADIKKIGLALTEFGIDPSVDLVCRKCGREWKRRIPTQDFFESGLRAAR